MVRLRAQTFVKDAGGVILVLSICMWALLRFPELPEGPAASAASAAVPEEVEGAASATPSAAADPAARRAAALEHSAAGRLGKLIEPAIAPLGFDWRIGIGLIGSFAAREVFVSTMGLVYGIGEEVDEESDALRDRIRAERRPDGRPVYSPLAGMSLLVFFALACQCMSTLAVVKRETRGYRWPAFLFVYMTALAWICSFALYQGGQLLGLEG
jgi:ferrous iron transport protein B